VDFQRLLEATVMVMGHSMAQGVMVTGGLLLNYMQQPPGILT
jgi:hypothetical protein